MFTGSLLGYLTLPGELRLLLSEEGRFQPLDPDERQGYRGKGRERMGRTPVRLELVRILRMDQLYHKIRTLSSPHAHADIMDVERSEFWDVTSENSQQRESWEAFRKGIIGELGQKDNPLVT